MVEVSPDQCSAMSAGIPLAATAPTVTGWIIVEVPGAWGRNAVVESGLSEHLARSLLKVKSGLGLGVLLARKPGAHPRREPGPVAAPVKVWLMRTAPHPEAWVATLDDPTQLLDVDLTALVTPHLAPPEPLLVSPWRPLLEPTLFVCTNGKRDLCCATLGRAALQGITDAHVWECSHLGGHRFAATALLLPSGYLLGRLSASDITATLAQVRQGHLRPTHLRGYSGFSPAEQAADVAVRANAAITSAHPPHLVPLTATAKPDAPAGTPQAANPGTSTTRWRVHFDHLAAEVEVQRNTIENSVNTCRKPPVTTQQFQARLLSGTTSLD